MNAYQRISTQSLLAAILTGTLLLSACHNASIDPMQQTIPTDSDQWQKKLSTSLNQLSPEDRQLLSRYMLRMKLSDAYESGAMPRTTIAQALDQQREYERLHPNNPTGKKSPVVAGQSQGIINAQTYPVALLPVKTSDSDSLNQVKLQFMLSNHAKTPIQSFEGTLLMKDAKLTQGKRFKVPLVEFETPITPEQSGKIVVNSSIEDINVMRAIKNAQEVSIEIEQGTITLTDGEKVTFTKTLTK